MMDRQRMMQAAWDILEAGGRKPSHRLMQSTLKLNYGSRFNNNELSAWLQSKHAETFKMLAEKIHESHENDFMLRTCGEHVKNTLVTVESEKPSIHAGEEGLLRTCGEHVKNTLVTSDESSQVSSLVSRGRACCLLTRIESSILVDTDVSTRNIDSTLALKRAPSKSKTKVADVSFDDEDEARVAALLASIAAQNKTGMISPSRIRSLRAALRDKLDQVGSACWRHGVESAVFKGAGIEYAVAVMRKNPQGTPSFLGRPAEKAVPKSLQPSDEKLALYRSLGR